MDLDSLLKSQQTNLANFQLRKQQLESDLLTVNEALAQLRGSIATIEHIKTLSNPAESKETE